MLPLTENLSAADWRKRRPLSTTSYQLHMMVPDQTMTDAPRMQFCSRLTARQEASATDTAHT